MEVDKGPDLERGEGTVAGGMTGGVDGIINGAFPASMEFSTGGCGGIMAVGGNLKGAGVLMGVMLNGVVGNDCEGEGVDGAEGEKGIGF